MKFPKLLFLFSLVLLLVLSSTRVWSQSVSIAQLHTNVNTFICSNNWDKALNELQFLINSKNVTDEYRKQLLKFRTKLEGYQANNVYLNQRQACDFALGISPTMSSRRDRLSNCSANLASSDGKCFQNTVAKQRHENSWEDGDRPAPQIIGF
ncbi:MAG: hypothetical protein WCD18_05910 [Thermosynechococcaceae cyanobacterium]